MSPDPLSPRGALAWTVAAAAVTGLCSLGLVHYLAQTLAQPSARPTRFAKGVAEPEVTGAIASARAPSTMRGVRSVVLDPGTGRERLLVRGP